MTTIDLYRKHKAGEVSREKFLYEVRRDNNLPFITNLTSYDDAVKILKNRGIVTEVDTKEAKADEAVKAENKTKAPSVKKPKTLHIDVANPYEYRHGIAHELNELGEYTDEALEKAKVKVLKNLAKDANFYSNLLNQKQSHYKFKTPESQDKGAENKLRPDGRLKKELKKDEKANVKDNLGNKEAGKLKPKGVKIMPDKGVTGSSKTIKEGFEIKQDQDEIEISADSGDYVGEIENGKASFSVFFPDTEQLQDEFGPEGITKDNWKDVLGPNHAFVKIIDTIGGDVEAIDDYVQITVDVDKLVNSGIKEGIEEAKRNKYIYLDSDGDEMLDSEAIADYLRSVIDPEYIDSVDTFMEDDEGYGESATYFFDSSEDDLETTEQQVEDWAKQEMSYYLFSSSDEFPVKENMEEGSFMGGVDLGSSFDKFKQDIVGNKEDFELADENALEDALKTHDWYYRMSDDPRAYDKGEDEKIKITALMKKVPRERAVELYNKYSPWKMQNEDKHSKLKEILKKKVREILDPKDIQAAKKTGSIVNIPSSDTQAQTQAKSAKLNYKTYGQ